MTNINFSELMMVLCLTLMSQINVSAESLDENYELNKETVNGIEKVAMQNNQSLYEKLESMGLITDNHFTVIIDRDNQDLFNQLNQRIMEEGYTSLLQGTGFDNIIRKSKTTKKGKWIYQYTRSI